MGTQKATAKGKTPQKGSKFALLKKKVMTALVKKPTKAAQSASVPKKPPTDTKGAVSKKAKKAVVKGAPLKAKGKNGVASGADVVKALANAKAAANGRGAAQTKIPIEPEAVCREVACEGLATAAGYCRLHYVKNWKKIKRKELILKERKLNRYIEELVAKYPDKYIEAIRQDLASDKDFAKVIYDLDLDESVDDFDVEGETVDSVIDTLKRDFEDEGEGF